MKLNLCLIKIKRYTKKDGNEGAKCIFLSENDKPYTGFLPAELVSPELEALLVDTNTFVRERARAWEVDQDVWNDKLTYNVNLTVLPTEDT